MRCMEFIFRLVLEAFYIFMNTPVTFQGVMTIVWFNLTFQASQDESIKQKESLSNELRCLRGELQQVRDDRDRQVTQVQILTAELVKYEECTGKTSVELDNLTIKLNALEVCFVTNLYTIYVCQPSTIVRFWTLFQETCSSQREQIRILQHQLVAANEKLKVMLIV